MTLNEINKNDIAEKYVLGKLSPEQKTAYESFLKNNEQARKELGETRTIINGLQSVGADAMRREIERQVDAIKSPKTDWTLLYKAAAILFIFVLVPSVLYFQLYKTPKDLAFENPVVPLKEAKNNAPVHENLAIESDDESLPIKAIEDNARPGPILKKETEQEYQAKSVQKKQRKAMRAETKADISSDAIINSGAGMPAASGTMRASLGKRFSEPMMANSNLGGSVSVPKIFTYKVRAKTIRVSLTLTGPSPTYPDSFLFEATTQKDDHITLGCSVPQVIFELNESNIVPIWLDEKKLQLTFRGHTVYVLDISKNKSYAKKTTIKK